MTPRLTTDHDMISGVEDRNDNGDSIYVELPSMRLPAPPDGLAGDEEALKEWVWQNHKETIRNSLSITKNEQLDVHRKRWELVDRVARVQRNFLESEGPKVVYTCLLNGILELTQSEYGFIGEVKHEDDGTAYLDIHATTTIGWAEKTLRFFRENGNDLRFYNMNTLFGKVYTTGKPVISNNAKRDQMTGTPEGHPPVDSFFGVPLYGKEEDQVIGMICISNKQGGYSLSDVDYIEPFTATGSNLIQAYKQIEENNSLINTLEEKVQERTKKLEVTNQELEDANRCIKRASAAQLQHFACMSHEIRTPLNCIIGMSSVLQTTDMDPVQKETLDMIVTSSNLLLNVVNDVLDFSKLASGNVEVKIQHCSLQKTFDAIVHSMESKAQEKAVTLQTFFSADVPEFLQTDSRRLQQILFNLCGNAYKFSRVGGTIELHVDVVDTDHVCNMHPCHGINDCSADLVIAKQTKETSTTLVPPRVHPHPAPGTNATETAYNNQSSPSALSRCPMHRPSKKTKPTTATQATSAVVTVPAKRPKKMLRIVVKDYGCGIPEAEFANIFQPFKQASLDTEQLYGGTGLGLSITSKLATALGGTVSVDSKLGEWSKFTLDLPLEDQENAHSLLDYRDLENTTVFVIDSDRERADRMIQILGNCKIQSIWLSSMSGIKQPRPTGPCICLVSESIFEQHLFDSFATAVKNVPLALITFGPNYTVKDSDAHFRSLSGLLPQVLLRTFQTTLQQKASAPEIPTIGASIPKSSAAVDFRQLRILIAEDNLVNQKVLHRMLQRLGLQYVDTVNNGLEAVQQATATTYDCILMDHQMPVMDGVQACRMILSQQQQQQQQQQKQQQQAQQTTKIVFVTAHVVGPFKAQYQEAGSWDFLPKPFKMQEIKKCLQKIAEAKNA